MKPAHDPTNRNCSCTSCMYKSESERPSIHRMIAGGSRIDKLYFGKYIPLRERKLLDRLVRTRAVYDDIRNQLLSESDASMREKPNLKPKKHHVRKDLKGKRSSAIIEIVDMVDKGKVPGPKTSSECCNCCICGSKTIHSHHEHSEMRKQRHGHGRGREMIEAMSRSGVIVKRKMGEAKRGMVSYGRGYAHRMSRTSAMMGQLRESKRAAARTRGVSHTLSRTSMMIKQKMGEAKRNIQFKAKKIMSEPCTCTSQLSAEVKRRSREVVRSLRPQVQLGEQTMFEGVLSRKYSKTTPPPEEPRFVKKEHRRGKALRDSYQKIKKSKAQFIENVGEGARKIRESKTKLKKHIEAEARKSLEKIKDAKQKINENIKSAVQKSIPEIEFPIKKDSIIKFKEKIKIRRHLHDYECDHECIPGECDPKDCFRIITLRRKHKKNKRQEDQAGIIKEMGAASTTSEMGVQAQQKGVVVRTETDRVPLKEKVVKTIETYKKKENKKKGPLPEPRISIDIGAKKRSVEVKVKTNKETQGSSPKETRSVKSMTSIPPVTPKPLPRVPSGPEFKKEQRTQQNEIPTSVVLKTRKRRRTEYQHIGENIDSGLQKGKQPAKVSSSFSFSLQVHKGKEANKPIPRQIYIQRKEQTQRTKVKEMRQRSQTKIKYSKRDIQTGSHALKRCFCTLKLKGKGYKPKPSAPISMSTGTQSQTSRLDEMPKEERVQTKHVKGREMACATCPSEKCEPSVCVRLNKNRQRGVGTKSDNKSISSLASRSVSTSSISTLARAHEQIDKVRQPVSEQSMKSDNVGDQGGKKQVVRISSSFSFNIEFYKDRPAEIIDEPTSEAVHKTVKNQSKSTHKRKHLRHKHSQISSSTGKSKYTLTKHSLKRCFCTLKLGQPNKKKTKPTSRTIGSATSQEAIKYKPDVNRDLVSVNKGIVTEKKKKYRLSPDECEPGICVPGECDPYACLELINKRQIKYSNKYSNTDFNRLNARHSNTMNRRTKSTSSFTSRSVPDKVKMVQSSLGTYERKQRGKTSRPIKTTHSSPNRQVVRIGSSFSFNIEFYKDNVAPEPAPLDVPLNRSSISTDTLKKTQVKERGHQNKKIKNHEKSTSMLVKKKNRGSFIAPMKRCFCTLKLQTKDRIENTSIGTVTPVKNAVQYQNVMYTKGTKTKQGKHKYGRTLEPYECEPGVCIPGECDPYECLQRIQMRQMKESSTATDKAKMKSATSVTQRKKFRSKGALVRSKLRGQKVSTITEKPKNISQFSSELEQKPQRQAVRIGSSFSFDIEFRKDKPQFVAVRNDSRSEATTIKKIEKMKNRGAKPRKSTGSHQDSQASISKAHKGTGIRPMLKRCFCTLKLQGNQNTKVKRNLRPPKVIAVSRVSVTKTKFKSNKNLFIDDISKSETRKTRPDEKFRDENWATALYNFKSSRTISKSSIVFRYKEMESYFRKNFGVIEANSKSKYSPSSIFAQSNYILPTFYTKVNEKYAFSENCMISCKKNEKRSLKKKQSLNKYKRTCLRSLTSSIFSEPQTRVVQIKRQNFYAMNIQVPERSRRYKLKPYECEPGICVPDECDPYECQKLIMKRLRKYASKMSGTNINTKSMSSSTAQSTSSSKKLQSKQRHQKAKKIPAGGMTFKTMPSRSHKQAVRVGSSFTFNIEFSKDRSAPQNLSNFTPAPISKLHKPTKPQKKKIREHGTEGRGMKHHDHDSQSAIGTANKGSGMKPMMERCFCTLKLQKKGKNQRTQRKVAPHVAFNRGTATPPNTKNEFITSRTMMNAGQNTAGHKLLPYECEPLVCVPGECDPYECLERIKRRNKNRKDSGTGPMRYKTSAGSMTGQTRYRTQGKQIQSKLKHKQTKSKGSMETRSSRIEYQERPSKQAVRIGSSFSFNVEFFKENSQSQKSIVPRESQRTVRPSSDFDQAPRERIHRKKLIARGSQDSKFLKNKDSQMTGMERKGQSTMTNTLLKRCFCTAKLHGKQKPVIQKLEPPKIVPAQSKASQSNNRKPFLKRCFCVLQKLKGSKQPKLPLAYANAGTGTGNVPYSKQKNKKVVTHRERSPRYNLEPYECEPGVCVPGECNPYDCEKLIKARNFQLQTREAYTDKPRTRSTSSNFSSQTSKARKTQSNFKTTSSTTKPKPSNIVKEVQPVRLSSSDRQVVRIGSTFSFSVEFYKDRSPNRDEVQAAAKAIRQKPYHEPKKKSVKTSNVDKETRDRAAMGTNNTSNQESQVNKTKMHDRGSGFGPALKRCFCTLKLQKRKKEDLKLASQGTETMKEIPTLQTRGVGTRKHWKLKPYECEPGVCVPYQCDPYQCDKLIKHRLLKETAVMTTGKERQLGYTLLPYECEPGVCTPGQCDPYECEKRIKMRNIKHRDSGTGTKRHRGKSVSSDIRSTTSSRARKVQHRSRERRKRSQSVSSKQPRVIKSLDTSTRQSVRIGSGFSFDVEFYKNKSNTNADSRVKPYKQRVKPTRSTTSSAIQWSPGTKNRKLQHHRAWRDTDSQMYAQKVRDTGVNPFLKRCFCTLKLQKSGDIASAPKIISKAARDRSVYLATLLPYECEPGVCIPGECDPYECQKRIQRRLMRSQRSGTERGNRSSSSSSTTGAKYKTTPSQSGNSPEKQRNQKGTYAKVIQEHQTQKPIQSSGSSSRQAIRIGSSFKFDVEFYKDRSPKMESPRRESYTAPKKRMHNITTKPKHKTTKSRSTTSSEIRRQHNRMQAGSQTESKSTGFGPRLKRCFCTLALHKKKSPPETRTKATFRNDDLSDLYAFSRNVGVGTRKKYAHLKPYECEPGVCVPGSCDPYECYERIKRRMKDSGTATVSPSKKYASSITSKDAKYRSANTQSMKARQQRERPTMANIKERAPQYSGVSKTMGNNARQAVRIGSNFSFSVEFYKDRPNVKIPKTVYKIKDHGGRPSKSKLRRSSKVSATQRNYRSRPSYAKKSGSDQECQSDSIKNTTRGTTMGALLKRCFCTLNLHKNNRKAAKDNIHFDKPRKEKPKPEVKIKKKDNPPQLKKGAMVQTRDKYTNKNKIYSLQPYECEPNVCIPGECDPYECLERIKRRNIRRQSRRIGTHKRSQVSVGSMASKLVPRSSRRVQSGERRARYATRPSQASKFVEEPRFAHMLEEMRTGVKIGSNISFNIEFYKDKSQNPTYDEKRYETYKPKEIKVKHRPVDRKSTFSESRSKAMHKGTGGKCDRRTCESQASGATMMDKGAGVNNMLKRCFCTLKLQKNPPKKVTVNRLVVENVNPMLHNMKMGRDFPQFITVNRLAIKNVNPMAYKKIKKGNQMLSQNINICATNNKTIYKCKPQNRLKNEYSHSAEYTDSCKEMTTIYPYIPNKYNKNISDTILIQTKRSDADKSHNLVNKYDAKKTKLQTGNNKQCRKNSNKTMKSLSISKPTKTVQKKESNDHDHGRLKSMKLFFKRIFPHVFSKTREEVSTNNTITEKSIFDPELCKHRLISKHLQQDTLKTCKSDRQPTNIKDLTTPKKTISLKINAQDKKRRNKDRNCHYQTKKKYSRYQSGDYKLMWPNATQEGFPKPIFPECNNTCAYCQVLKDTTKKNNPMSPYESTNIVQMSLVGKKDVGKKMKSASTTTNANKKIKSRSKGIVTDNKDDKNSLLSQCMCFVKKTRSIKSNVDTMVHHSINGDKNRDTKCCPCGQKTRKLKLSSGDVQPNHKNQMMDKTGKLAKKGKKVEFDEISLKKNEVTLKKRKAAAGDAPVDDKARRKEQSRGAEITQSKKKIKNKEGGLIQKNKDQIGGAEITQSKKKIIKNKEGGQIQKNKDQIGGAEITQSKKKIIKNKEGGQIQKKKDQIGGAEITQSKKKIKNKEGGQIQKNKEQSGGAGILQSKKKIKKNEGRQAQQKGKLYGAKLTIKAKGDPNRRKDVAKINPCVCGSTICIKESRKMEELKTTKGILKGKKAPCICGSAPCALESKKKQTEKRKATKNAKKSEAAKKRLTCVCAAEIKKRSMLEKKKLKVETKKKIELEKIKKKFKEEDEKRKKERMKRDKVQDKRIKKMQKSGDGVLAAESVLDVLKLGLTASVDMLRCSKRALLHPRHTALSMKELAKNPSRAFSAIGSAISNSGIASTIRRVRKRCASMKRVKIIKAKLESYAATRYLMYMCSKDSKKRFAKSKRMVRRREPIEFECSLFMASLRRRPCLAVYYSCPWFYPHCLSMLNLWKQFTDIMLFLIAVTVWSPCIVMMEICRAAMCCFFCTG